VIGLDRDRATLALAGDAVDGSSQAAGRLLPVTLAHAAFGKVCDVLDELEIALVSDF
jgi:hypothetical protein